MGFGDVDDDYDPARPNDYMEYCRERINKKKQEERDRELKIIMEEQEREVRYKLSGRLCVSLSSFIAFSLSSAFISIG